VDLAYSHAVPNASAGYGITQVAHLFSQTALDTGKVSSSFYAMTVPVTDSVQEEYANTALGFLKMFGLETDVKIIQDDVNSLQNVLTMSVEVHMLFDNFEFWLEYVPDKVSQP
jgi:hypothetical protein